MTKPSLRSLLKSEIPKEKTARRALKGTLAGRFDGVTEHDIHRAVRQACKRAHTHRDFASKRKAAAALYRCFFFHLVKGTLARALNSYRVKSHVQFNAGTHPLYVIVRAEMHSSDDVAHSWSYALRWAVVNGISPAHVLKFIERERGMETSSAKFQRLIHPGSGKIKIEMAPKFRTGLRRKIIKGRSGLIRISGRLADGRLMLLAFKKRSRRGHAA